jgi:hypothetical protein
MPKKVSAFLFKIHIFYFNYAGELFFITDRESGFWNLHKWVILFRRSYSFLLAMNYIYSFVINFWSSVLINVHKYFVILNVLQNFNFPHFLFVSVR